MKKLSAKYLIAFIGIGGTLTGFSYAKTIENENGDVVKTVSEDKRVTVIRYSQDGSVISRKISENEELHFDGGGATVQIKKTDVDKSK